jgi:uncharacterized phage protein (TIGR01671 family)
MREILFRGKRTDNGEWVEGHLIWYEDGRARITPRHIDIFCHKRDERIIQHTAYEVIPETIGQYTGLTAKNNKNGNKIFEGDIVKYGNTIHKVIFEQRNGTAYFGLVYNELETLPFGHYQDLKQIEVIGNIHDNPELLKEGADNV